MLPSRIICKICQNVKCESTNFDAATASCKILHAEYSRDVLPQIGKDIHKKMLIKNMEK